MSVRLTSKIPWIRHKVENHSLKNHPARARARDIAIVLKSLASPERRSLPFDIPLSIDRPTHRAGKTRKKREMEISFAWTEPFTHTETRRPLLNPKTIDLDVTMMELYLDYAITSTSSAR